MAAKPDDVTTVPAIHQTRPIFGPEVLEDVPSDWVWSQSQCEINTRRQQTYEARQWTFSDAKQGPGCFASEEEFKFYRLLRSHPETSGFLLLSNVKLTDIVHVNETRFNVWCKQQCGDLDERKKAKTSYMHLVVGKSVDLIAVDKDGKIAWAVEVDGDQHREPDQVTLDREKSYHFKVFEIPLLRISAESVRELERYSNHDGHEARLRDALKKMRNNWLAFTRDPSVTNMQMHFANGGIVPVVPTIILDEEQPGDSPAPT